MEKTEGDQKGYFLWYCSKKTVVILFPAVGRSGRRKKKKEEGSGGLFGRRSEGEGDGKWRHWPEMRQTTREKGDRVLAGARWERKKMVMRRCGEGRRGEGGVVVLWQLRCCSAGRKERSVRRVRRSEGEGEEAAGCVVFWFWTKKGESGIVVSPVERRERIFSSQK
ncbi:hypothetical protein HAX54_010364 [Datura stramonium]|uniref:Uncharacterized protein n=1 Tax=Datura stramonium TaxID=4076 RepID=A0ABS8TIW8_DATST|nr:hypothetical protein [Datura stramonium]